MSKVISRLFMTIWFIGMVVIAVRGTPAQGQVDEGELLKQFLPLLMTNTPAQVNPPLQDYVAVGTSEEDGDSEIYTVRADGSETVRLTDNTLRDDAPRFSPDGQQIAFIQKDIYDPLPSERVMVMNRDGSNSRPLVSEALNDVAFAWSPDGKWILINGSPTTSDETYTLLKVAVDGSATETILADRADPVLWGWSPDGAFFHYGQYNFGNTVLWLMDVEEGTPIRISDAVLQAEWHPDGRDLLVRELMQGVGEAGRLVTADGGSSRLLYTGEYHFVGWIVQGQALLLQDGNQQNLATVPRMGGTVEAMTNYLYGVDVDRRGISPDGSKVLYRTFDATEASPLYLHPIDGMAQYISGTCYACDLGDVAWAQDYSGLLFLVTLGDRIPADTISYLSLQNGIGARQDFDINGNGWTLEYLPFSSIYGMAQSNAYEPPQSPLPRILDTKLIETTVLSGVPIPFAYAEWRYLP